MKKLLSLIGAFGLTATTSSAVVSCSLGYDDTVGGDVEQIDLEQVIKNKKIEMLQEDFEDKNTFALLKELSNANKDAFLDTSELEAEMNIEENTFFVKPKNNSVQYIGGSIELEVGLKGKTLSSEVKNQTIKVSDDKLNDLKVVSDEIFKQNPEIIKDEVSISKESSSNDKARYSISRKKKSAIYNGASVIINAIKAPIGIGENIQETDIKISQELANNSRHDEKKLMEEIIKANKDFSPTFSDLELYDIEPITESDKTKTKLTAKLKATSGSEIYDDKPLPIYFSVSGKDLKEELKGVSVEVPNGKMNDINYIFDNTPGLKKLDRKEINTSIKNDYEDNELKLLIDRKVNSTVYKNNKEISLLISSKGVNLKNTLDNKSKGKDLYNLSALQENIVDKNETVLINSIKENIKKIAETTLDYSQVKFDFSGINSGDLNSTHIVKMIPVDNSSLYYGPAVLFYFNIAGFDIADLTKDSNIENGEAVIDEVSNNWSELFIKEGSVVKPNMPAVIKKVVHHRYFAAILANLGINDDNFTDHFYINAYQEESSHMTVELQRKEKSEKIKGNKVVKIRINFHDTNINKIFTNLSNGKYSVQLDENDVNQNLGIASSKIEESLKSNFDPKSKEWDWIKKGIIKVDTSAKSEAMWKKDKTFLIIPRENQNEVYGDPIVGAIVSRPNINGWVKTNNLFIESGKWNESSIIETFKQYNPLFKNKDFLNFSFDTNNNILKISVKDGKPYSGIAKINLKQMTTVINKGSTISWSKSDGPISSGSWSDEKTWTIGSVSEFANDAAQLSSQFQKYKLQYATLEIGGQGDTESYDDTELWGSINSSWSEKYSYRHWTGISKQSGKLTFKLFIDVDKVKLNVDAYLSSQNAVYRTWFNLKIQDIVKK